MTQRQLLYHAREAILEAIEQVNVEIYDNKKEIERLEQEIRYAE